MKRGNGDALELLGQAIGLPAAFSWWCEQRGVQDVATFLSLPLSREGPDHVWAMLQAALREARDHVRRGDRNAALEAVERLLSRPEFRRSCLARGYRERAAVVVGQVAEHLGDDRPATNARLELVRAGGIASARHVADRLEAALGEPVSVRQVRDRFRHTRGAIVKLGAGYYATRPAMPVLRFVERLVEREGPLPVDRVVDAVLAEYPNGHGPSIRAWLHQEPGSLRLRGGRVVLAAPEA